MPGYNLKLWYDRISILLDEIEVEEVIDDHISDGQISNTIVIYLLNDPKVIQPRDHSDQLCNQINSCFDENDGQLLWESIENFLRWWIEEYIWFK